MSRELPPFSDNLPLNNYTELYAPDEENVELAAPLTVAHLQQSLDRWKEYEKLLGGPIPTVTDILSDEKAAATLSHLHTTHKALVASGSLVDKDNGEEPTLLASELQLVALPWKAFRRYADTPRQLIKDIHEVHQGYFDQATLEYGARTRVVNNSDQYLEFDLSEFRYHQPGTSPNTQESISSYIDRKIEKEGPWGFMLIQKGEHYTELRQFPITNRFDASFSGTEQRRFWAGETRIAGDSLGILEWSALLAGRTPDEVANEALPSYNLDASLYANPLFRGTSARIPMIRHQNARKSENVHLVGDYIGYNQSAALAGRLAIAANTDSALLDEIIEDGAKLPVNLRLPYTWAKRQLEGMNDPGTVVSNLRAAELLSEEVPRLMDVLRSSPEVAQSLGRLHLAQLFYKGVDLRNMGIEGKPLPTGKYSSLELMPWQALLEANQKGIALVDKTASASVKRSAEIIAGILKNGALEAASLSSLPRCQRGGETEDVIQHRLHDFLINKVATEGPWGLALRGLMPETYYGRDFGVSMFTL